MKKSVDLESAGESIDFDAVGKKLDALTTAGKLKRNKYAHLLDPLQSQLVNARKNGVTLMELTRFLNESGIPVSEPTLRKYLTPLFDKKRRAGKTKPPQEITPAAAAEGKIAPERPPLRFVEETPVDGSQVPQPPPKPRGRPRKDKPAEIPENASAEAREHLEKMKGDAARKREALYGAQSPPAEKK